jgi:hypothetical protein
VSEYSGVNSALGVFIFGPTKLTNGVHTLAWGVTDDHGGTAGIGSRYFNVTTGRSAMRVPSQAVVARGDIVRTVVNAPLQGRRGFDLKQPFETLTPDARGRITLSGSLMDRFEVHTASTTGYLRTASGLGALPIGSHLATDGTFTWQPGVAFIGSYDFVFETADGLRELRVVLDPAR